MSSRPPLSAALALAAAVALAGPALAADPAPGEGLSGVLHGVSDLATFDASDSQSTWLAIKGTSSPGRQLSTIRRRHLDHTVCKELVDLRALAQEGVAPFGFRDGVRGRTWARPSVALVLTEALQRFQREHPGRTVTLGDVAQPGCGQLDHGKLVKHFSGPEAVDLVNRARVVLDEPTVVEELYAADFPAERWRFETADQVIRRETVILGKRLDDDGQLTLRVAQRRHLLQEAPDADKLAEMRREIDRLATRRQRIDRRRVTTVDAAGMPQERWLTHYVDRRRKRQLVAVTTSDTRRRFRLDDALELRFSTWHPKKPGSFKGEIRWVRVDRDGQPTWERWRQLYEAGHISHHSGLDADISWVTKEDRRHFAVDLDAMDVAATWRWLELLVEVGRDLGAPVELILVDPKIKRHLRKHLPKAARRSPLYRKLLRLSGGHDAHHHLRLEAVGRRAERRAARDLQRRRDAARAKATSAKGKSANVTPQ